MGFFCLTDLEGNLEPIEDDSDAVGPNLESAEGLDLGAAVGLYLGVTVGLILEQLWNVDSLV